ncbi:alpha/beta fold hydrolase [Paenibacillus roseipurpureus]|uniref:Alpha/beta hydrolase n=1 Tax=Paenibacillus roseopurpureus TaxID=2918901 RepID=A0AA96RLP8_9BACL|nr:alpha/beta hydrolase [Paenibacillus sp. MBLB1832]WNR45649.1 alpha/beta hydrolase [Paenibacillus sp. MBLB1832]
MPFANVNGTTLHYEVTGPASGKPIVFIHPPLLTLETFAYQKEQLSKYFRVITFDIRGHGGSACTDQELTYSLIAADITHLLDHLNIESAYVCGYSTGGTVALEAMIRFPSRFRGGIIVSGMSELTDLYNLSRVWLAIRLARPSRFMKLLIEALTYGNADKSTTYQKLKERATHDSEQNVKSYFEQSMHYSCTNRLSTIQQPVLLIYGLEDRAFHPYAQQIHSQLPHSSLYFIKDAKHQIPFKSAPRMNDLIQLWLDSLDEPNAAREKLDLAIARRLNPSKYGPMNTEIPLL